MSAQRHIRFEDEALQAALLRELDQGAVPYTLDSAGAVWFSENDSDPVTAAAHRVRDAQFSGYFLKCKTEKESRRLVAALRQARLQFFVEHHESGTWLLVRRADKPHHERLVYQLMDGPEDSESE